MNKHSCGTTVEDRVFTTFSYKYCPTCKVEVVELQEEPDWQSLPGSFFISLAERAIDDFTSSTGKPPTRLFGSKITVQGLADELSGKLNSTIVAYKGVQVIVDHFIADYFFMGVA